MASLTKRYQIRKPVRLPEPFQSEQSERLLMMNVRGGSETGPAGAMISRECLALLSLPVRAASLGRGSVQILGMIFTGAMLVAAESRAVFPAAFPSLQPANEHREDNSAAPARPLRFRVRLRQRHAIGLILTPTRARLPTSMSGAGRAQLERIAAGAASKYHDSIIG